MQKAPPRPTQSCPAHDESSCTPTAPGIPPPNAPNWSAKCVELHHGGESGDTLAFLHWLTQKPRYPWRACRRLYLSVHWQIVGHQQNEKLDSMPTHALIPVKKSRETTALYEYGHSRATLNFQAAAHAVNFHPADAAAIPSTPASPNTNPNVDPARCHTPVLATYTAACPTTRSE